MKKSLFMALIYAPLTVGAVHAAPSNTTLLNESVSFGEDNGEYVPVISTHLITQQTPYHKEDERASHSPVLLSQTDHTVKAPTPEIVTHSHFIYPDESYLNAINRWLQHDSIKHLAWSIDELSTDTLKQSPAGVLSFDGTTTEVIPKLSRQLGVPLYLSLEPFHQRAAIHQWHNREVQIAMVGGTSLKETVRQLTLDYGWQWSERPSSQSWLAANDYGFSISYPIVTPKGDIKRALTTVLNGYPVSARLLDSNHTVFIVDTQ